MTVAEPVHRLIVASNRLPFVLQRTEPGEWTVQPGTGGLVTALVPVLRNRGGVWIGWPGVVEEDATPIEPALEDATKDTGYTLKPVLLTSEEKEKFYYGFSNEVIWPLFHDLQSRCNFDPSYWHSYKTVNRKFAKVIARNSRKDDFVWVHDYHLMEVAKELHDLGCETQAGFFLHTPFPPLDIFIKLPWRSQILHSLLEYDLLGFQSLRDRRNFLECVRMLMKDAQVEGEGQVLSLYVNGREVRVGAFPIGIDFNEFARSAASIEVSEKAWAIRKELPNRQLILGVDRLDYTKGIPFKLEAFRNALSRYPELRQRVTLIQVVVPSREHIPEYFDLKTQIERLVGEINGQFTRPGWVPVHYQFRRLDREELLAYYLTSEIGLITPLKDGMNLVAKEYCAVRNEEDSVLILSEFAGAAAQLQQGVILVNPYHTEGVADAIHQAFTMGKEERHSRMRELRRSVREYDIFWWVGAFLKAAIAKDLDDFPLLDDYVPVTEEV